MDGNIFPEKALKEWFMQNRRSLPWRSDPSPYRVWISEIMLQQTRVAVVLPYFERWMEVFPSIAALAEAPIEHVLKLWEGLGYYSRARNLHAAARYVVEYHNGELPRSEEALSKIKGLGPYTRGAICSFAFREKAAAVDGNVLRVLSRFYAIEEEIDRPTTQKQIREYAKELLPDDEPWLVSEGLIELGATVCTKKPLCSRCPLMRECLAYRHGLSQILPNRRPRQKTIQLHRQVAVVFSQGKYLVQRGEKGRVMADLYEFPYLEIDSMDSPEVKFGQQLGMRLLYRTPLCEEKHTFTRYRVHLYPHLLEATVCDERYCWQSIEMLEQLPFSSGHKRILKRLMLV